MSTLFIVLVTPVPLGSHVPSRLEVLKSCQVRVGGFAVEVCHSFGEASDEACGGGGSVLKGVYAAQVKLFRWDCSCNLAVHDMPLRHARIAG